MRQLILLIGLAIAAGSSLGAEHEHAASPSVPSQGATPAWTKLPRLEAAGKRGGERNGVLLRVVGLDATEMQVFSPDGGQRGFPIGPEGARIQSAGPTIGNYHWVSAREERPEHVAVASTAWYFSNPGQSPTQLLSRLKSELEIVPSPLPREHGRYRESEKWKFQVRFLGEPLAGKSLRLETSRGSQLRFTTDANGIATVLFPRDFTDADDANGHGRASADFVLAVEHTAEGRHYLSSFSHSYAPDADRGKSLGWGGAFLVAGMLGAVPILRRRQSKEV